MRDSLEGVVCRLAGLPPSPGGEVLRVRAGDYLQQARGWRYSCPTRHEREALMQRVLALLAEVAKLEREMSSRLMEGVV